MLTGRTKGSIVDTKGAGRAEVPAAGDSFGSAFAALSRSLRQLLWMTGLCLVLVIAIAWRVYS